MKKYEVATKVEGKELGISQKNIDIYITSINSNCIYKIFFNELSII